MADWSGFNVLYDLKDQSQPAQQPKPQDDWAGFNVLYDLKENLPKQEGKESSAWDDFMSFQRKAIGRTLLGPLAGVAELQDVQEGDLSITEGIGAGAQGSARNVPKTIGGVISSLPAVAEMTSSLLMPNPMVAPQGIPDSVKDAFATGGDAISGLSELAPVEPQSKSVTEGPEIQLTNPQWWTENTSRIVGDLSQAVGAFAVTKNPMAFAAVGGSQATGQAYHDAKSRGASNDDAGKEAVLFGGTTALLDRLLPGLGGKVVKFMPKVTSPLLQKVGSLGASSVGEGTTEALQEYASSTIAAVVENNPKLLEGVNERALKSFILSLGPGAASGGMTDLSPEQQEIAQVILDETPPEQLATVLSAEPKRKDGVPSRSEVSKLGPKWGPILGKMGDTDRTKMWTVLQHMQRGESVPHELLPPTQAKQETPAEQVEEPTKITDPKEAIQQAKQEAQDRQQREIQAGRHIASAQLREHALSPGNEKIASILDDFTPGWRDGPEAMIENPAVVGKVIQTLEAEGKWGGSETDTGPGDFGDVTRGLQGEGQAPMKAPQSAQEQSIFSPEEQADLQQQFEAAKERQTPTAKLAEDVPTAKLVQQLEGMERADLNAVAKEVGVKPGGLKNEAVIRKVEEAVSLNFDRQTVAGAFPGSQVSELPDGGFRVEVPAGHFDVRQEESLKLSDSDWARAEKAYGKKFSAAQKAKIQAAGEFRTKLPDGTDIDGLGLIRLNEQIADATTLPHEAVHLAKNAGFFTDKEWQALVGKHSDPKKNQYQQEEDIARAREAWKPEKGLIRRIRNWFNNLLSKFNLADTDADAVMSLMDTAEFWQRKGQKRPQAEPDVPQSEIETVSEEEVTPEEAELIEAATATQLRSKYKAPFDTLRRRYDIIASRKRGKGVFKESMAELKESFRDARNELAEAIQSDLPNLFQGKVPEKYHAKIAQRLAREIVIEGSFAHDASNRLRGEEEISTKEFRLRKIDADQVYDAMSGRIIEAAPERFAEWLESDAATPYLDNIANYINEAIGSETTDASFQLRNIANPATDKKARKVVEQRDKKAGAPEVRPDVDVQREAAQRLKKDYKGERRRILASDQLGDTETVMAKEMINREAMGALKAGDLSKLKDAVRLIDKYRQQGTEQARAFRQRRDPVETPKERRKRLFSEVILSPDQKTQKKVDAAKAKGDTAEVERLQSKWAEKAKNIVRKTLKGMGLPVWFSLPDGATPEMEADASRQMEEFFDDPDAVAEMMQDVQAAKSDIWDKTYEYWRNAILSAPATQSANLVGNAGFGTWKMLAERSTEAMVNTVLRQKGSARAGEIPIMLAGALPGFAKGAKNFLRTFQTERSSFEEQLGVVDQKRKIEETDVAIRGKKGKIIRIPQRLLLAFDDWAKTMVTQMDVAAQAYRLGKDNGLAGDELSRFMATEVADVQSDAWANALLTAQETTFQQEGGKLSKGLKKSALKLRENVPFVRYVLPFVTTPMNIFAAGLKRAPVAADISTGKRIYDNVTSGKPALEGVPESVARQVIAWTVALALLSMTDEDDPWVTGAEGSSDIKEKSARIRAGRPPLSIKIGGEWYSYARVEPVATTLGMTVDGINRFRKDGAVDGLVGAVTGMADQVMDKTFLSGISDIVKATESERSAQYWVSRFASSWVPNIARHGGRLRTDDIPYRGIWGDDSWKMTGRRIVERSEWATSDVPLYDVWGRKVKQPNAKSNALVRIIDPITKFDEKPLEADIAVLNWNNKSEDQWYPSLPDKKYKADGDDKHMTPEQYGEYARQSGTVARKMLERLELNEDDPTEADIDLIQGILTDSRKIVKEEGTWLNGQGSSEAEMVSKLKSKLVLSAARKLLRKGGANKAADIKAGSERLGRFKLTPQQIVNIYRKSVSNPNLSTYIKTDSVRDENLMLLRARLTNNTKRR